MGARTSNHAELLGRAKAALRTSSEGLGQVMGVSRRTMTRRWTPSLVLDPGTLKKLATAVLDADRELAEEVATAAGTDLESWGLVPCPAPAEPEAPAPISPPIVPVPIPVSEPVVPPPDPRLVDSVVCVAADLLQLPPQGVRQVLYEAFRRARELGLDMETVEAALAPVKPPRAKPTKPKP